TGESFEADRTDKLARRVRQDYFNLRAELCEIARKLNGFVRGDATRHAEHNPAPLPRAPRGQRRPAHDSATSPGGDALSAEILLPVRRAPQIGRASCRERGW